ncbi:MAG: hypothetical protein JST02_06000 [Bacteroidetes bacterium]|nr:hypothetical protein [Bacteroidota bacterium]
MQRTNSSTLIQQTGKIAAMLLTRFVLMFALMYLAMQVASGSIPNCQNNLIKAREQGRKTGVSSENKAAAINKIP